MKVCLLYPDRDWDWAVSVPPHSATLMRDLGLNVLLQAMAGEDEFLEQQCQQLLLRSEHDTAVIFYRQAILQDFLRSPDFLRELYRIPVEFAERKRQQWLWVSRRHSSASSILSGARRLLEASLDLLSRLRQLVDRYAPSVQSSGLQRFCAMVQTELHDAYLAEAARHVRQLRFPSGVVLRARLGRGNESTDYVLCKVEEGPPRWLQWLFRHREHAYTYYLHPRDEAGARILGELRDQGLARTAHAVAQAAEHVESFFTVLRRELAFYVGCLQLSERLKALGEPVVFPTPAPLGTCRFTAVGLYDVSLALSMQQRVVGNAVAADGKPLVLITGPNRGGKTTFLRSIGIAQLMMQSGMFVPAEHFSASLCTAIFTHFKQEEEAELESGAFEAELKRMRAIVDQLDPSGMLLLNESFSTTNEREGSEIAWQLTRVLINVGVRVWYVTHFTEYTQRCYTDERQRCLLLRAERLPDGSRTFLLQEAEPETTSYGIDVYRQVFGAS